MLDDEGEEGDGLDFMDIMRRLIMRGQNEEGGGPSNSIFSRQRDQPPQEVEADPMKLQNLVDMGFPEVRVK